MPDSLYPQAVNLTLATEQHQALKDAREADKIPANARLRGLLELWAEDAHLQDEAIRIGRLEAVDISPQSGRRWPERMLLEYTEETHQRLIDALRADGIPVSTRIRALVTLWMGSPRLQQQAQAAGRKQKVRAQRKTQG